MSEVASRIPFDRTTGKYKRDWRASQEEQVSSKKQSQIDSHCGAWRIDPCFVANDRMLMMIVSEEESMLSCQTTSRMAS